MERCLLSSEWHGLWCLDVTSQYDVMWRHSITSCDVTSWRQITSNNEFGGERTTKCPTQEVLERSGVFILHSKLVLNMYKIHYVFLFIFHILFIFLNTNISRDTSESAAHSIKICSFKYPNKSRLWRSKVDRIWLLYLKMSKLMLEGNPRKNG